MQELTPKPSSERLRMALRLRLTLRRASDGRQREESAVPAPVGEPLLRVPASEHAAD